MPSFFRDLLFQTTRSHAEIVRPFLRAVRDRNRVVFQADAFRRRALEFLKRSYLLLLTLEPHSDIVRPILRALFLDER